MGILKPYFLQVLKRIAGVPIAARHTELSLLASTSEKSPNKELLRIALAAIKEAATIDLSQISKRVPEPKYPDIWPGEHYKLLAGIVKSLRPKVVVEIGTYTGMATLSLKKYLPENGLVVTFDIVPWTAMSEHAFKQTDFDARLVQHTDNLTQWASVQKHKRLLQKADVIFIDAAKDGKMEYTLMEHFVKVPLKKGALLVFDDIKVWNMLHFWETLEKPKLDVTSFGHWAGTGLVLWE